MQAGATWLGSNMTLTSSALVVFGSRRAMTASSLPLGWDVVRLHHLERCAQKPGPIAGSKLFTRDACRELYDIFCNIVGSIISPLLANIFLHEVLDAWYERDVKPRMKGRTFLIRFADDFVIGCEREEDARRIMAVLPKRFARFGLTIHPTKTVLVAFRRPVSQAETDTGNGTCECLGFTHYWTKSRRGSWVIKRKTASKRLRRTMKALWQWCRDQRHTPLIVQHRILCQKLRGHYQYYGIRGNYPRLQQLYEHAGHAWRYWLSRRSQQRAIPWERFDRLHVRFPLPAPRILHVI